MQQKWMIGVARTFRKRCARSRHVDGRLARFEFRKCKRRSTGALQMHKSVISGAVFGDARKSG